MPIDARKTKAEVQYQGEPKGGRNCWTCPSFLKVDQTCRKVRGALSGNGWCSLYPEPEKPPLLTMPEKRERNARK